MARADSQLASDAAATAKPALRPPLAAVSSERSKHAEALSNEIARMTGEATDIVVEHDYQHHAGECADRERRRRRVAKVRRQRRTVGGPAIRLPRRTARLDRRVLHGGLLGGTRAAAGDAVTSAEPTPLRGHRQPSDADVAALFDAVASEHAVIYGYGLVSAHSTPEDNDLVSAAMSEHRERREAAIETLKGRGVDPPLPAAGYQLPMQVDNPTDAANLAVRMEEDAAVAWRAALEQATTTEERAFAVER